MRSTWSAASSEFRQTLLNKRVLAYDQLVLAIGSLTNTSRIPGSEFAFTFKTLADAILLRSHLIERMERAEAESDLMLRQRNLTFVVIGGGLVGVEVLRRIDCLDGRNPSLLPRHQA